MNLRYYLLLPLVVFLLSSCSKQEEKASQYVNPFIGTDAHGHVYPGAATPFGMVQLSPDTRKDNWDACSGYHYSDSTIMGFSHTHLSGTGVGDYGDIRLMPTVGELLFDAGTEEKPESGYRSRFTHETEQAQAGYYGVKLQDYDIDVELTASPRVGFHKYTFPQSDAANVILDLTEGVTSDRIFELWIEVLSDTEIQGFRRTKGWSENQYIYFNAQFSKPFENYTLLIDGVETEAVEGKQSGKDVKAGLRFQTKKGEEILVKVGISAVSAENARLNRETEIPHWDFEKTRKDAEALWNKELGRIEVEGDDEDKKTVFYTSLYHAMLNPNLYSDVNGEYRGHDMQIHTAEGFDYYTIFSLWDTYRTAHPLLTIIDEKRTNDFINTMLKQYEQGGLLPVWELAANETNCMIGYHAVPVIVDAYMKNIRGYDAEVALDAGIKSAMQDLHGINRYKSKAYIPSNEEAESVSKTLEYAYDDWCIAQMAKEMGREDVYNDFIKRAQYYKNVFDPQTKFMRAKLHETWFGPFDPSEVNSNYTEANSWQYSFYVPQDVSGLMQLLGGADSLAYRLDWLFSTSSETTGRKQSDITGLIGQYAHGNEPSHHMAYLYNYCGQPWKTQTRVRQIMDELYTCKPDGLCGNEDCGQMSAWYVMSAMGFYPVAPGSNIYTIGSPDFDKITIHLENGKQFVIEAKNYSINNRYIQSASINGQALNKSYFTHSQLADGGQLIFELGEEPNKNWASSDDELPVSEITDHIITPVPFIQSGETVFSKPQNVALSCADSDAKIYFSLGDVDEMQLYTKPFTVSDDIKLKAYAVAEGKERSSDIETKFIKIGGGRNVKVDFPYVNQYNGGGDIALIDLQRGTDDFRIGAWQGYEEVDLIATIDLGEEQQVSALATGFLQDVNAWIFMPDYVEYSLSVDGKKFRKMGRVENPVAADDWERQVYDFPLTFGKTKARYIKVIGKNRAICPEGHKGAGYKAWIFVDEVMVK